MQTDQLFGIANSDMGKTEFIGCNFKLATFSFENSQISNIFTAQTDFADTVRNSGIPSHKQEQLVFGQLTTSFQKQGDNVRTTEYLAREIESHYNDIDLFIKVKQFWQYKLNLTKITLWLNKWSNNFGRDWGRAFIFTFGIGIVIFYSLILSTDQYEFGLETHFKFFFPSYIRFMNPIRFFDTKQVYEDTGITFNNWVYFWDLFGRVVAAYGFYQLVAAFRKYGKKS